MHDESVEALILAQEVAQKCADLLGQGWAASTIDCSYNDDDGRHCPWFKSFVSKDNVNIGISSPAHAIWYAEHGFVTGRASTMVGAIADLIQRMRLITDVLYSIQLP